MKKPKENDEIQENRNYQREYSELFPGIVESHPQQQWRQEGDIIEEYSVLDESGHSTTSSSIIIT